MQTQPHGAPADPGANPASAQLVGAAPSQRSPAEQILYEVKKTIVGQDALLERMLTALLSHGHILVEGVPGLAKTLAVKSLASAVGGQFNRVQFTPDLVPADIIGTRVYHQRTGEFQVALGPVFTNLLLADEINRAPAKVQSVLLEVTGWPRCRPRSSGCMWTRHSSSTRCGWRTRPGAPSTSASASWPGT